jgi:ferredoxin/flavodoxin
MNESKDQLSALIIYLSPHGTTKKAVDALAASLNENGVSSDIYNLSECDHKNMMAKLADYPLIVLGSPTYFHHAPAVFTDLINKMPTALKDQSVVLLSSFGGVSSGVVLYDLAKILHRKKYDLIGGIQVLTEHCLTFQDAKTFYSGHPDKKDLETIQAFGKEISVRLKNKIRTKYSPSDFNDKPFILNVMDDRIVDLRNFKWAMPGIKVNQSLCNSCAVCFKNCPTKNIRLDKVAMHGNNCIYCYSCVRNCPVHATTAFLKPASLTVKLLAKMFRKFEDQTTKQIV